MPSVESPAEWLTGALHAAGRYDEAIDAARIWRRRAASNPLPADVALARLQLLTRRPGEALRTLEPHQHQLVVDRERGPLVLEVNARPGLEIQNVTGIPLRGHLRGLGLAETTP